MCFTDGKTGPVAEQNASKELYEKFGYFKEVRNYLKDFYKPVPNIETISAHIKRLFLEEDYIKIYGLNGYNKWYSNNSGIQIDFSKKKIKSFNSFEKYCKKKNK